MILQVNSHRLSWQQVGLLALLCFGLCCQYGCTSNRTVLAPLSPETSVEEEGLEQYVIGLEDVIDVIVWKNADLSREVTVRPDGMISLPLIGDVEAAGYTTGDLSEAIKQRRQVHYKKPPAVSVIVKEVNSYVVYILGEVSRQGRLVARNGMTVLQALALSEGFTEFAASNHIVIQRKLGNGQG